MRCLIRMQKPVRIFNLTLLITLIFLVAAPGWAAASFTSEKWQYQKPIILNTDLPEATKYVQVELDGQTYNHTAVGGLADLRVIRGGSAEVPYYLYNDSQSIEEKSYSVTLLNNSVVAGEYSSFIVDMGQNNLPNNRLNLDISDSNFLRRVEVSGTDNLSSPWNKLPTTDHIFDFQGQRSTQIHYTLNNFRYLKVVIWNKGEKPLTINGAQVFYRNETPVSEKESKASFTATENQENKTSELTFDLGYANFPTHRILLECLDENFNRQVSIQGSNDGTNWQQEGDYHTIYSYNIDNQNGKSLSIGYPELSFRYIRVVVQNKDNPPLKLSGG
ncbi:MAG TPA: DUF3999 family protein, partial [Bacillota bacterium]|nr:DUF3999 family protein [Bacillota bacterium]